MIPIRTEKQLGNTPFFLADFDYHDCYSATFEDATGQLTATDLGKAFFTTGPRWIDWLFALRNSIVARLGLKVPDALTREQVATLRLEPKERVGLFNIISKTEDELIFGEEDRHLDFKVALWQTPEANSTRTKRLYCLTVVKYNNFFGRLYFFFVKPFHRLIVPRMMRALVEGLDRE